ncbi:MAG: TRAM domain-containing protein [Persephonella sp.]|nr:TRAM domain-containing protein [Persephonella sp.]
MQTKIEKLVYGGEAIAKIDSKVCFIPFVIPDEEVEVRITEEKKSYLRCEATSIIKSLPTE